MQGLKLGSEVDGVEWPQAVGAEAMLRTRVPPLVL